MNSRQITLPFRLKHREPRQNPNFDLIGRSYDENEGVVTVIGVCHDDAGRVMVQRDIDGRTWSMPAWLMRLVFMEKRKRAA